jgi:hypothetical protein
MEQVCPNCGATNRGTSRFCARCGHTLPGVESQDSGKSEGSVELPWLQAVQDKAVQSTSSLGPEGAATQDTPGSAGVSDQEQDDSLAAQAPAQEETPQEQLPSASDASAEAQMPEDEARKDEPPPPWVVSILEPSVTPPGPEQSYEPEELSHIMPWAHGKPEDGAGEAEGTSPPGAAEPGSPGMPPWLGDVTVQETLQSLPPSEQNVTEPVEINMEGIEPFVPPAEEVVEEQMPPEQVPAWLRTMSGTSEGQTAAGTRPSTPLRSVTEQPTDRFGTPPSRDVPVRPPRAGAVEALAALMQPIAPEASQRVIAGDVFMPSGRAEAKPGRLGWRARLFPDGLIYLLIVAVLLTVLIVRPPFGEVTAPAAPGVLEFFNAVEAVPENKPVLVVYDWDASRSGEMSVLARAVMHHIMLRQLPFVTVSTVPQGPGFAQLITNEMTADTRANYGYSYGTSYLVLGYLPGNEAALKSLVTDFHKALPLDYVNSRRLDSYKLVQGGSVDKIEDFGLIVDLASSEAELRNWIEQVASRTNVPIVAAVSQGLEPFARPYVGVPGAKLSAVVSGVAGANQYSRQLQLAGKGGGALDETIDLNTRLNSQSVASLLVGLVIVAAFVTFGLKRIMRR